METIKEMERQLIYKTLALMNGNKTHAAKVLGITPRSIRNKLKIYTNEASDENSKTIQKWPEPGGTAPA